MTILQAIDYLGFHDKLSTYSRKRYEALRAIVPSFSEDTIKYKDIQSIIKYLLENKLHILPDEE